MTRRIAVFGYASLASPASASETLGRPVDIGPIARLSGWSRAWTLGRDNLSSEKTFARADGSLPRYCLGLNLERDPAAPAPNGVLIELTEAELERLDLREMRYNRVAVTGSVTTGDGAEPGAHGFDLVVAYTAKPEHHHPTAPDDAVILSAYPATIEAAFDALGPGQLELFRSTTATPPVDLVEATLVRDRIPPGNPRAW